MLNKKTMTCQFTAFALLTPALAIAALAQTPAASHGTEVKIRPSKEIKSNADNVGDVTTFTVSKDVKAADGTTLIPAGTPAFGKIIHRAQRGIAGKGGGVTFTCDYVQMPDGSHLPVTGKYSATGRNNLGPVIILFPIGLLVNGRDAGVGPKNEFTAIVQ